jgi:hypothetical protein
MRNDVERGDAIVAASRKGDPAEGLLATGPLATGPVIRAGGDAPQAPAPAGPGCRNLVVDPDVFGQCVADELARSEGAAFRMSAPGAKRKGPIGKPR